MLLVFTIVFPINSTVSHLTKANHHNFLYTNWWGCLFSPIVSHFDSWNFCLVGSHSSLSLWFYEFSGMHHHCAHIHVKFFVVLMPCVLSAHIALSSSIMILNYYYSKLGVSLVITIFYKRKFSNSSLIINHRHYLLLPHAYPFLILKGFCTINPPYCPPAHHPAKLYGIVSTTTNPCEETCNSFSSHL